MPALLATENRTRLSKVAAALASDEINFDHLTYLYHGDSKWVDELPPWEEWFESDDEIHPVHPYVALTEDDARLVDDIPDEDEENEWESDDNDEDAERWRKCQSMRCVTDGAI